MKKKWFLPVVLLAVTHLEAQAQLNGTPSDQLQQLTVQLQKSPDDVALREKIIALALTLNPKPATPDAATMAEGAAEYAFKNAKVNSDFADAAKQYEKALLLAPWLAADYFNCGVAHEKAGENKEAIGSFNLYLLSTPNADDAQAVKKRIGGLQYAEAEADTPEGKAAKVFGPAQQQFAVLIQKLNGTLFARDEIYNGSHWYYEVHFYESGRNHLVACARRERYDNLNPFPGQDGHHAWEADSMDGYVMPTDGRGINDPFVSKPVGEEFIIGCRIVGRLSADGRTMEEINAYSKDLKVNYVWRQQ